MITHQLNNISENKASFALLTEKLLDEANTGSLIIDKNFVIQSVNNAYKSFHGLLNSTRLESGEILNESSFSSFPETFYKNLKEILEGIIEKTKLTLSFINSESYSYNFPLYHYQMIQRNLKELESSFRKRKSSCLLLDRLILKICIKI